MLRLQSHGPDETRALGEALGGLLQGGDVVALSGEMGSGKTVFAQGVALGLDVSEPVNSPTFALVHEYAGRVPVWHLDTYRVQSLDELIDLSWQDLLAGGGVILVEWPERIRAALPPEHLDVTLHYGEGYARAIEIAAHGARPSSLLRRLAQGQAASHKMRAS